MLMPCLEVGHHLGHPSRGECPREGCHVPTGIAGFIPGQGYLALMLRGITGTNQESFPHFLVGDWE